MATLPKALPPDLLKRIVCPISKQALVYDEAAGELVSPSAGVTFPIIDGIPILIRSKARQTT